MPGANWRSLLRENIVAASVGEGKALLRKRWDDLRTPPPGLAHSALARWKRERGYALERLLVDLARAERLDAEYGYHRTGEQVDGYFVVDHRHFLLEAKWHEIPIAASDVFAFQGKLRGKLLGTLGLFVSIGKFAVDAPSALVYGKEDRCAPCRPRRHRARTPNRAQLPGDGSRENASGCSAGRGILHVPAMARREPIAPLKLVFFVEGNLEKAFLEALVPRILGPKVAMRVVRVGGKAAFSSTFFEAAQFLEAGYASVFLLLDADTEIPEEIDRQKRQLMEVFRRYGLMDRVQIHMAVPMLEAWLLAAYRAHPEQSTHPKRDLARYVGADAASKIGELAAALPIEIARHRSRSLDDFITALEAYAPSKTRRAS
jgi:hypothetical protein